jgi:hypothetical protein
LEDRCLGNQAALLFEINLQVKHATQGEMHDLRQRHCPDHYADAALLEVAKIGLASLVALSIGVQNQRKK